MSDIEFNCPSCGGQLVVGSEGAGQFVNCPRCSQSIQIPSVSVPASVPYTQPQQPATGIKKELIFGIVGAVVVVSALAFGWWGYRIGKGEGGSAAPQPSKQVTAPLSSLPSQPTATPQSNAVVQTIADYKKKSVEELRELANKGDPEAQNQLGWRYDEGEGVTKDEVEGVKWHRKAAEQNYAKAQNTLGYCYANGQGVAKDEAEAVKWYRKAAEQNIATAQCNLGNCYLNGQGVMKDAAEAVKWLRKAAEQNYAVAQCNLGYCYEEGQGVPKDEAEAVKWYRKAVEQNYAWAQCSLGNCYLWGTGVVKDEAEAVTWFRKAAEQGDVRAQFRLGECYENGQGVTKDRVEATKWWHKAADSGDAEAQYSLGWKYSGVPYFVKKDEQGEKDRVEAVKWWRKAAEQNHVKAQCRLGNCYHWGEGVTKDEVEAARWWRKAADKGDKDAKDSLEALERDRKQAEENAKSAALAAKARIPNIQNFDLGELTTTDGRKYSAVKVTRSNQTGITIRHSSGILDVPWSWLPESVQKQLGYDAAAVASYSRIQTAAQALAAQIQARAIEEAREKARKEFLQTLEAGQVTVRQLLPYLAGKNRQEVIQLLGKPPDMVHDQGYELWFRKKVFSELKRSNDTTLTVRFSKDTGEEVSCGILGETTYYRTQ